MRVSDRFMIQIMDEIKKEFEDKFVFKDEDGDDYGNSWDCSYIKEEARPDKILEWIEQKIKESNKKLLEDIMKVGEGKWDSDWDRAIGEKLKNTYHSIK